MSDSKEAPNRVLYCPGCRHIGYHSIKFLGTKPGKKSLLSRFETQCFHCDREFTHEVPVKDYNALISKEIFAA